MMRRALIGGLAVLLLVPAGTALGAEKPGGEMAGLVVVTSTVEKIDMATREVTVKGENGKTETFKVGPEARNLGQLRVGDRVTAKFYRSLAIFVAPPGGAPSASETSELQRAALGEKPGGQLTNVVEVTARVEAVDLANKTLTLKGPKGNTLTLHTGDRVKRLDQIKVGDQVVSRYIEAMAIYVEKP